MRFHKSRLKIAAAEVQDNGVYSCQASNGGGQATSLTNFILNVPGKWSSAHWGSVYTGFTQDQESWKMEKSWDLKILKIHGFLKL